MFIVGGNQTAGGYDVDNSLRFVKGDSSYLNRTFSTPTSTQKCTYSGWVKRSKLNDSGGQYLLTYFGNFGNAMYFNGAGTGTGSNDQFVLYCDPTIRLYTNRLFRDASAWYHIVVAIDTTQSTASNRVKIYVNGVQETSFHTETYPAQNGNLTGLFGATGSTHDIGRGKSTGTTEYFGGYMSEIVFIDGQQLDPTSFGEFDEDSGVWKPIDVSGLSFGNNGFYLPFENSGALGQDDSGNGNDFTTNNISTTNPMTDTPTNNFATLNANLPLFSSSFIEGNCRWTPTTASQYYWTNSTFGLSQGKWYMEAKLTTAADHNYIGIASDQPEDSTTFLAGGGGTGDANDAYQWGYKSSNGQIFNNASGSAYGDTYTTGDIMGMYLDLDNNKLYFAKNGTIQNSGTGISITDPGSVPGTGVYFPCVADGTSSNSSTWEVNFGNPTFTISSGNSDPNGYGNFEYSPNDGGSASFDSSAKNFYAINTKNLAEYG